MFEALGSLEAQIVGKLRFAGWRISVEFAPGRLFRQRQRLNGAVSGDLDSYGNGIADNHIRRACGGRQAITAHRALKGGRNILGGQRKRTNEVGICSQGELPLFRAEGITETELFEQGITPAICGGHLDDDSSRDGTESELPCLHRLHRRPQGNNRVNRVADLGLSIISLYQLPRRISK